MRRFLEPFREVLACVTGEGFVARGARPGGPFQAAFQSGLAVLARRGGLPPILLRLFHRYFVVQVKGERNLWEIRTAEWIYDAADAEDTLIVAFHWHPVGSGRVTWPHLHAYGQHPSVELHKLHLPTGPLSIAAVVRFLIEDLDVLPRRANWDQILGRHGRPSGPTAT